MKSYKVIQIKNLNKTLGKKIKPTCHETINRNQRNVNLMFLLLLLTSLNY